MFTSWISNMRDLNYWDRLERLNLYSMERRRDRYIVIYVFKIITNLVPNISSDENRIITKVHPRRGKLCLIPQYNNRSRAYVRTLREGSFSVYAPKTFNALPKSLRACDDTLEGFKSKLDKFLKSVPDRPSLPHYYQPSASNSLIDQLAQMRVESIY